MSVELPTKKQVTKKFIIGVVMIIFSFIIGKLAFVPLLISAKDPSLRTIMFIVYGVSWLILFLGIFLAGVEGYRLATRKYKVIHHRTVAHVKKGTRRAAGAVAATSTHAAKHTARATKSAARYTALATKIAAKHTGRAVKKGARVSATATKETVRKIREHTKKHRTDR